MQQVKIYTASPSDLSPPVQSESFCVDLVLASDYRELEAKCAALAAENTALKKSEVEFNEYCRRECEDVGDTWEDDFTETPATDAFLAEVRAQGVEMFADKYRAQLTALPTTPENIFDAAHVSLRYQIFDADEFAAQLRKGVQS
ncbi:hypothetical protein GKU49_14515 [Salmonella enterica]|nr:hypothetical protein [Salmonella enterica]EDI0157935.1 hypothetical protein [Salmonella enterica subsp. enterica serovar Panama]EIU8081457.1 hypothetical protein [Salmonella enterica subsp. enterica serovar Poona]EBI3693742.1 hypothetical protein [Salmonella enterica]EBJ2270069.1 hypothetical protein [Salmonella enterica]